MPTPPRPATGVGFGPGGFGTVDNRFNGTRTMRTMLAIRDARGVETNISPHDATGAVLWTPFASDAQLRGDLFAQLRSPSGAWQLNTAANDGWYLFGASAEGESPNEKQGVSTDDQMIDNQIATFDSMLTGIDEVWSVTPVEVNRPVVERIRNHLPLNNSGGGPLVELPGGRDAGYGRLLDADNPDRQLLKITSRAVNGQDLVTVKGASLCKLSELGDVRAGKKGKPGAFSWKVLGGDGVFCAMVSGSYQPIVTWTWYGGAAWLALGGATSYTVAVGAATAGTFTLNWRGLVTATIPFNATAAAVRSALAALDDGYVAADWSVTGAAPTWTVKCPGPGQLIGTGTGLTGGALAVTPVG